MQIQHCSPWWHTDGVMLITIVAGIAEKNGDALVVVRVQAVNVLWGAARGNVNVWHEVQIKSGLRRHENGSMTLIV